MALFFNQGSAELKGSTSGMISKGSAGLPVLSKKKLNGVLHLWSLDTFSRLLVSRSKMYLRSGLRLNPAGEALQRSPRPSSWWGVVRCPPKPLPLSHRLRILVLRVSGVPPKDMGSVNNQHRCKGFRFTEKIEKHCIMAYNIVNMLLLSVCIISQIHDFFLLYCIQYSCS